MPKLIQVGFFRELHHGNRTGASLRQSMASTPADDEEKVVRYLKAGQLYIASPGVVNDVLSESDEIIGSPHYLTDGIYTWPADFAYYVERYHVRPPQEFIDHMARNQWALPAQVDLSSLAL